MITEADYDRLKRLRKRITDRAIAHEHEGKHLLAKLEREKASGVAAAIALLKGVVAERVEIDRLSRRLKYKIAKRKEARA